ncbi:HemK2/MTQ2 family protein methyltransferase [Gordonia sp. DT219]|uniref:HemK2/MTQ2 family protein methyltransferase n=1 Tax=Gordonia sp. DT219 TaxID=3416658 RepID=UPI003CF07161
MTLSFEQTVPEPSSHVGGSDQAQVDPDPVYRPEVYQPQEDSRLLVDCLRAVPGLIGARALDLCTGSGVLAQAAAHLGARSVVAVDLSEAAVRSARERCRDAPCQVEVRLGRFQDQVGRGRYDVVTCNPPYVPAPDPRDGVEASPGPAHAWDAGPDGRAVLDPLCAVAAEFLEPGGTMLVVQSEFADVTATVRALRATGLHADVMARWSVPFGPVMTARADWLERRGLLEYGRRTEDLVVVRAVKRDVA